jgi:CheY-like chemotaxis protein
MVSKPGVGGVLVVEADAVERERFGSALEAAGYDVLTCPGPTEPDYTCVGARDGVCPLVEEAAVVVLDMSLDSEALMTGTPAEEILGLYLTSGRPVVVLGSRPGPGIEGQLVRLRRHVDDDAVVAAVRELHPATRPLPRSGPSSTDRPGGNG